MRSVARGRIDLKSGDILIDARGSKLAVSGSSIAEQDPTAFNLSVDELHTYFVGDYDALVHNCPCSSPVQDAVDQQWGVD